MLSGAGATIFVYTPGRVHSPPCPGLGDGTTIDVHTTIHNHSTELSLEQTALNLVTSIH